MTETAYRVILHGKLPGAADIKRVAHDLGRVFKTTPEKAEAMLNGKPRVIRDKVSKQTADIVLQKMHQIGVHCSVEAVNPVSAPKENDSGNASLQSAQPNKSRYSIEQFVRQTSQQDRGQGEFELENERLLEINLETQIWIKTGGMVAYRGDIVFERENVLEKGFGKFLKKAVTGEGARLTRATGQGTLYLADQGKKIIILNLQNDVIYVNGNDILALELTIDWDINIMRKVTAMMAGGLFNVRLEGTGMIAITSHYDPLTLKVTPGNPVRTDPNATIAWSGSLQPELRTDVSFKTFLGRGSGESIQMEFEGEGFVVVQPFEEVYFQNAR
jgi:uncharacterized protein (AIM24 family)